MFAALLYIYLFPSGIKLYFRLWILSLLTAHVVFTKPKKLRIADEIPVVRACVRAPPTSRFPPGGSSAELSWSGLSGEGVFRRRCSSAAWTLWKLVEFPAASHFSPFFSTGSAVSPLDFISRNSFWSLETPSGEQAIKVPSVRPDRWVGWNWAVAHSKCSKNIAVGD